MTRYLLDTNALADAIFRRRGVHVKAEEARLRGAKLGSCFPAVAELLGGIENSSTRDSNLVIVNRLLSSFRLWPFELDQAREYARLYAVLRKAGITIGHIDLMIAATARILGKCTVISSDSDLKRVPGLSVENWADS
jgi:tRNA(fMet)-specific endonuclease VapC